jgi:phage RecT family recombinase
MNSSPATTAPRPSVDALLLAVDAAKDTMSAYLPDGVSIERFVALAKRQIIDTPRLAECTTPSVLRALSAAAASGLPIDGRFSSLIVRDSKHGRPTANWDPSYRGMITLALASGFVIDVQSGVVRDTDHFEFSEGSAPSLVHRRSLLPKWGEVIASWATARLKSNGLMIEILTAGDIAKIRAMSPAGDRGAWGSWEDQMARKAAIRRLLKKLPAGTVRLSDALQITTMALTEPHRIATALQTAATATPAAALSPEELNALECQAEERLRDADTPAALAIAWATSLAAFSQRGAPTPLKVEALHHDLAEDMAQGRHEDAA